MKREPQKQIKSIKTKNRITNILLMLISSLFALGLGEVSLRLIKPHNYYHSLIPDTTIDRPVPDDLSFFPGIDSTSYHYTNEFGYRGESYFSTDRYGILTIGGSTTYSLGVSDNDSWPWLLESSLNDGQNSLSYTVGNIGVPAFHSGQHLLQLKYIQPQFENVRMVVILMGINDYLRFLELDDEYYTTREDSQLFRKSFIRSPRNMSQKWYQRTEIWAHARDIKNQYRAGGKTFEKGAIQSVFLKYKSALKLDTLPNMGLALKDYEWNLRQMSKLARQRNIQLVYVTQPILWNSNMTELEEKISAIAAPRNNGTTYTPSALARGMQLFNAVLIKVANDENLGLIDLAKKLPKDTTAFYDYCHFNKNGNIKVAQVIENGIKKLVNIEPVGIRSDKQVEKEKNDTSLK